MQNGVLFSEGEEMVVARIIGEIDHHFAKNEREKIDAMIFKCKPRQLVMDFTDVRFMDSSGIGMIIGRSELCRALGCNVTVRGLNPTLRKLVSLSGVGKIKNISIE